MNHALAKVFIADEARVTLKQMYPLKAPSLDGMSPLFFRHFWSTTGNMVTKIVLDFLNSGVSPPNFNDTYIVLIPKSKEPKRKEPKRITDYRPISLCNVVYKIASKTIANRLKKFLPAIIGDTQNAFVHGRLIADNILLRLCTTLARRRREE